MVFNLSAFFDDPNYPYYLTYQSFILIGLVLSITAYRKGEKNIFFLIPLLAAAFLVEIMADVTTGFSWAYHLYNPIEYTLLSLYYLKNCRVSRYKSLVKWSIGVFIVAAVVLSQSVYKFHSLPALNINIEGVLLFVMYTHLLFNIDTDVVIYKHPDFWISTGILTYFGGVFACFNLYSTLLNLDPAQTEQLFGTISLPLNIILYTCIIISQICLLVRDKKYFTQLD